MSEPQTGNAGRYAGLDPETAARILKRRLLSIGGVVGVLMGFCSTLLPSLLFDWFPPFGSPMYLVLTFLAIMLIGAGGLFLGKRTFDRILSSR